ncbi:MAG: TetR/AcrR family transcriptional regulator [Spirochaetales bacterium]|nr:TetR/AcrR family transcriptional regulator [Spirochaetales bacterium]
MNVKERATRKRILDIAEELILTRGYNGFSYQDISETIGIRKASIHYHYPLKENLVDRYIRKQIILFKMWSKQVRNKDNIEKLNQFGIMYLNLSRHGIKICPIGMLSAEFPVLPEKIQTRVINLMETEIQWLEHTITSGIREGVFAKQLNVHRTALIIITTLSGMLKMLRIHKDPNEMKGVIQELISFLLKKNNKRGE